MASPAAVPVVESPASSVGEDAFRIVPWASCEPSPLNPRKHFDPDGLKELAGTMGSDVGVIEPLVVRPMKVKGRYEIVAGERRWRAADLAGLKVVPVIVREGLTEVQVLRMMVIENRQRKDLNALEEGEGFHQLTKRGVQIDAIAGDIKVSRKYVYDRIKLRDLVPVGQQLLAAGRISAGHAILIARETADVQARILDPEQIDDRYAAPLFQEEGGELTPAEEEAAEAARKADPFVGLKTRSVRELASWIGEHARFDLKAVNAEIYPETARAVEQAEKVVQITRNSFTQPDAKEGNTQRIYHSSSWKQADGQLDREGYGPPKASKTCDRSVLGVVVAGPGRGEAFRVCVHKECDVHWKAERQARAKASTGGKVSADKYAAQRKRERQRDEERRRKAEEERQAWGRAVESIVDAFAVKVKTAAPGVLVGVVVAALESGTGCRDRRADVEKNVGKAKTADDHLRVLALSVIVDLADDDWSGPRELTPIGKTLGVDLQKLLKAAVQTSAPAKGETKTAAKKASKKR